MASGSRSSGHGSCARGSSRALTEAPSTDNAIIAHQLNLEFEAMPAAELIAHLNRSHRTADFVDAALVFAARERRLADAEDLVHATNERMDKMQGEIEAHKYNALEAKAQIRRAAETEMGLRAEIRTLQLRTTDTEARVRHSSGINGRGLTQQASRGLSNIKEEYGEEANREVLEDALGARVTAGHKVPKEEAQGEDVAASHHRRSQVEQPARATKKARRQKGTSYYKMVLNTLMEKQELLPEKEAFAKEAAATASKLLYRRCWSNAPYTSAMSTAVKEESNDELNDS
ncbi:uncharacterized protein [Miscanthus floridulus]|uniref:uncharacterized protein n=1 Tax=Miscanthus floridulus TaxID=154761 RepID=UPI00345A8F2F